MLCEQEVTECHITVYTCSIENTTCREIKNLRIEVEE